MSARRYEQKVGRAFVVNYVGCRSVPSFERLSRYYGASEYQKNVNMTGIFLFLV